MIELGHSFGGGPFYFMHLITSFPKYSDGELNAALVREIQTGFQLERETEKAREAKAKAEADDLRGHKPIKGLGQCVATMPEREYYRLIHKYGHGEVNSRGFLRYFQKTFPHLSPNKLR